MHWSNQDLKSGGIHDNRKPAQQKIIGNFGNMLGYMVLI